MEEQSVGTGTIHAVVAVGVFQVVVAELLP